MTASSTNRFQGKVVLVTGGGTGIGKGITEEIVAQGGRVVITGRREQPLQELKAKYSEQVDYIQADVTKKGDPKKAVEFAVERFGQLDVLVNNAGVFAMGPFIEASDETFESLFSVNVQGLFSFSREAIPYLTKTKGNIVNISSIVATAVMPGAAAYSATKAAVDHFTRVLAAEVGAAGIRVNAVSPGLTDTDMAAPITSSEESVQGTIAQTPLGRLGQPSDIAKVVAFAASDDAAWVTGQIIASSGGFML